MNSKNLENKIREFINDAGDPTPYDFNQVVRFLIAALENLDKNALEAELEEIGHSFDEKQKGILLKIAGYMENHKEDE